MPPIQAKLYNASNFFDEHAVPSADDPAILGLTGSMYELGRLDEAIASYQQSLAIQPSYKEANHNLTVALRQAEIEQ